MIDISNIINISLRRSFKTIWQLLNLRYLYNLLYPFIAADFRHQLDCSACVLLSHNHTHTCPDPRGWYQSLQPTLPITVTPSLGLGQISIDPLSKLPANSGTQATVQPFDATATLNSLKPNIGIELQAMPELDAVTDSATKLQQARKYFSLK
jgi:hypothetical protein